MAFIAWEDAKYSVGVEEIDKQHKGLVNLLNQLHEAMKAGTSKEILPEILDSLRNYTAEHFAYEEKYMQSISFPQLPSHKTEHGAFVSKVDQLIQDYRAGNIMLSLSINNFLKEWLVHHICESDMAYSAFIKLRKGKQEPVSSV